MKHCKQLFPISEMRVPAKELHDTINRQVNLGNIAGKSNIEGLIIACWVCCH